MINNKQNRIAIFSFYDSEGIVYDYVKYYLNELKKNIVRLVIVLNGKISREGFFVTDLYSQKIKDIYGIKIMQWNAHAINKDDCLIVALNKKIPAW